MGKPVDPEKVAEMKEGLAFLDGFLAKHKFAAADHLTLADFSLAGTVTVFETAKFDISNYPNIVSWFARFKAAVSCYDEVNTKGMEGASAILKDKLPVSWS